VLLAKLPEVLRALDASSAGGGAPLLTQAIAALSSQLLSADTRSRQHQRFSIYEQRLSSDASATIRSTTQAELGGVELDDGDAITAAREGGDRRRQSSDRQLSQGAEEEDESEADECEYVVPALALQAVSAVAPDAADGGEVESLELGTAIASLRPSPFMVRGFDVSFSHTDASEIQLQRDAFGLPPGEPFIECTSVSHLQDPWVTDLAHVRPGWHPPRLPVRHGGTAAGAHPGQALRVAAPPVLPPLRPLLLLGLEQRTLTHAFETDWPAVDSLILFYVYP